MAIGVPAESLVFSPRVLALCATEELSRRLIGCTGLLEPEICLFVFALRTSAVYHRKRDFVLFKQYDSAALCCFFGDFQLTDRLLGLIAAFTAFHVSCLSCLYGNHERTAFLAKFHFFTILGFH